MKYLYITIAYTKIHILYLHTMNVSKKCIIITTINPPSQQVIHYSQTNDWDLIIVGDSKTNDELYLNLNCIYLGLKEQKCFFPSFYNKIPLNSYARKMFGYLYAIKNKYDVIYDTDDDNKYTENLDDYNQIARKCKTCTTMGFVNLYKVFTDKNIWPRGIPPNDSVSISKLPELSNETYHENSSLIQGLVNNDPDVDAYYRININNKSFVFEKDPGYDIILDKYSVFPINTQNTFWTDPAMFYAMYLPITVTFRYTDILRGFVALFQFWKNNKHVKITFPTAHQDRNEHDLQKDMESELSMYASAEQVIKLLNDNKNATLLDVYVVLLENGVVKSDELDIVKEWMSLVMSYAHEELH